MSSSSANADFPRAGSRYLRLTRRANMSQRQRRAFTPLRRSSLRVAWAWAIRTGDAPVSYSVEAFERAAVDYLLEPVLGSRLQETVDCLQRWLAGGNRSRADPWILESLIRRLADTPAYLH